MWKGRIMGFKHIVVAFDGSASATRALGHAQDMVQGVDDATLRIVSVTSDPDAVIPMDIDSNDFAPNAHLISPETLLKLRERALAEATDALRGEVAEKVAGLSGTIIVEAIPETTSIAATIVSYAGRNGCDLIVMGCRGIGALRGVLGSVSYAVLRTAEVPVLTCR